MGEVATLTPKQERRRRHYRENREQDLARNRRWHADLRDEVFAHYAEGDKPRCACPGCDVDEPMFLTIDHIDGGGKQHRITTTGFGVKFYRWLKREGFPEGYRILCTNCNLGRSRNGGVCPHGETTVLKAVV